MNVVVFDIETGPLDDQAIRENSKPFDRSSVEKPGAFDERSVKVGNLKDEAKIREKIEAARAAHAAAVDAYAERLVAEEAKYWSDIKAKAALSALTGRVLAIGYKSDKSVVFDAVTEDRDETVILRTFWDRYRAFRESDRHLVGFNIKEFDIPYIAQRSVILGVPVPATVLVQNRFMDPMFIDLRDRWGFCGRPVGTLDAICRACGLGSKPDGIDGVAFAYLYLNPETRDAALDYLGNDLEMTYRLAGRLLGFE